MNTRVLRIMTPLKWTVRRWQWLRWWLCLGCLLAGAAPAEAARRPNIVFLMADDLGWGDPRCYNPDSRIPTPHMDRLAAEGLRFTDMHSPSAVCTPTRYGLLTGRYAWRTRMKSGVLWGWSPPLIEPGRLTVPGLLRKAGYRTGGFGKWHLGLGWPTLEPAAFGDALKPTGDTALIDFSRPLTGGPHTAGFDEFFGIPASLDMEPYVWIDGNHVVEAPTAMTSGDKSQRAGGGGFYRAGPIAPGVHVGDVLGDMTRRTVGFIERAVREEPAKPFFAYVPFTAPHDPWLPHAAFWGRSLAGPRGDFVVQTDAAVGQILEVLDRLKVSGNTLVVFTSDNGAHWHAEDIRKTGHLANGPWRGQKSDIHEAGHRVPCLVRWPEVVRAGATTDQLACLIDWMATLAEITGTRLPREAGEDSYSFAPVLTGEGSKASMRKSLVLHSGNGVFALRRGSWKLVQGLGSGGFTAPATLKPLPGGPTGQLYHLAEDPVEASDRYETEPAKVVELSRELDQIRNAGRSRR